MHVADARRLRQQVKQQRRGDVVGQVADHPQGLAMRQPAEIRFQCIGIDNLKITDIAAAFLQRFDQVTVKLDHLQPACGLQQGQGDGALARADLHQPVAGLRVDGADDAADNARVMQKILAEAFPGAVSQGFVHVFDVIENKQHLAAIDECAACLECSGPAVIEDITNG
jgi:hypothetical protein